MNDDTEHECIRIIDTAFEHLAEDLDTVFTNAGTYSNEAMTIIRKYGDFITTYAEWIREGWDWANSEAVDA